MSSNAEAVWCWAGRGHAPASIHAQRRWTEGEVRVLGYESAASAARADSWIVFDGTLHEAGGASQTHAPPRTAAERVLALVLDGGVAALHQLNGMFAFALWDARRRRLVAARDRFGMKTLYFRAQEGSLAIGSRMAPLMDALAARRVLDSASAVEFLVDGFTDQDERTLFADLRQLPPGSALEFDPHAGSTQQMRWYALPAADRVILPEDEALRRFRALFVGAVGIRERAPETEGLMLSAGIDSSAIAGVLAQRTPGRLLNTYKAYFDSALHDQRGHVAAVVASSGATHREAAVSPHDLLGHRDEILRALEQPYERSIIAAHSALCRRMAQDGIRFTLDGVGADEQLGGYRVFQASHAALARGERPRGLAFVGASRPAELAFAEHPNVAALYAWLSPDAQALAVRKLTTEPGGEIRSLGDMCRYHMLRGALPMLIRFNRDIGAAFDQESSSPFLDHRLVEFSLALDDGLKIRDGSSKYVLRRALADVVPAAIVNHDNKTSYLDIEVAWLRGPSFERLLAGVQRAVHELPALFARSSEIPRREALDKPTILRMWRMDCLAAWCRLFEVSA